MKFVLVVLAVVVLLWMLRGSVRRMRPPAPPRSDNPAAPQAMLSCAHCGVHLPSSEALPGRGGVFCDDAHRAAFERAHPSA
jgi:uncharacterized protein